MTSRDVADYMQGLSPVAQDARERARREFAQGATAPDAGILRLAPLFGEEWIAAYVATWKALVNN